MYCVTFSAGVITTAQRVTSAAECPGSEAGAVGNPANGAVLLADPQDLAANPLYLAPDDALAVAGAVASLWVLAWAVRQVRRALD